jgi:hypothetical protein
MIDGTVDFSGGPLRCLHDDRHFALFVLTKEGRRWMVEVLHTWSYVAGIVGIGKKIIP